MNGQWAAGSVEAVFREDRSRLLALLAARFGDLDLAEEVTSEAIEVALERWPVDGVPDKPLAWLLTTARRKALDRIRRDRTYAARLTGPGVGPYAVQAAIAALHDEAADVASTDWAQIVALYDVLLRIEPSPIVALNRAMAVAMRDGPEAGLALLDGLAGAAELRHYHLFPAARGDLLRRLGRTTEAAAAYRAALGLVGNRPERVTFERRLAELTGR